MTIRSPLASPAPLLLVLGALVACRQSGSDGEAGSECKSDADCKNGLLCESGACLPKAAAEKIRASERPAPAAPTEATTAAPAATPAPVASAAPAEAEGGDKIISGFQGAGMKSKVPTVAEWNTVGEITVRHSTPLGCETKMVREWLRVSCRTGKGANQIQDVTVVQSSGVQKFEMFEFEREGVASIVLPIRMPIAAQVSFRWSQWGTRQLTVSYPHGAPAPEIHFDRTAPQP